MTKLFETVPYQEFSNSELFEAAEVITSLVTNPQTQDLLRTRRFLGVIQRYSIDPVQSFSFLLRARTDSSIRPAFVKEVATSQFVGIATAMTLNVERQTMPFPPVISREIDHVAFPLPTRGRNVSGWVGAEHDQTLALADVYKATAGNEPAWAIEPVDSPRTVRAGIQAAGFVAEFSARLDDQETKWRIPPRSLYYVAYQPA